VFAPAAAAVKQCAYMAQTLTALLVAYACVAFSPQCTAHAHSSGEMYASGVAGVAGAFREALEAPSTAVPFNSTAGRALLVSEHCISATFWMSVQHLATQKTQSYCGIATSAMALNTLALHAAPVDPA
jgi:hypothetical protein